MYTYTYTLIVHVHTMKIYAVDGNIGSGKTEILIQIEQYFKQNNLSENILLQVLYEPINQLREFKESSTGENILDKFYKHRDDERKYIPTFFQFMIFHVQKTQIENAIRIAHIEETRSNGRRAIIIIERSPLIRHFCFTQNSFISGEIPDWIYEFYMKHIATELFDVSTYFYLRTSTDILSYRINKRGRSEEKTIDPKYLENITKFHDQIFIDGIHFPATAKCHIIPANIDMITEHAAYTTQIVEKIIHEILN